MATKLKIVKTIEYVWRIGPFGNSALSSHNHIACWHVENAETGERVAGGHYQGSNCSSGAAKIPRKKDAIAWALGYNAAEEGIVKWGGMNDCYPMNAKEIFHQEKRDDQQMEHFVAGAYEYAAAYRRAAK